MSRIVIGLSLVLVMIGCSHPSSPAPAVIPAPPATQPVAQQPVQRPSVTYIQRPQPNNFGRPSGSAMTTSPPPQSKNSALASPPADNPDFVRVNKRFDRYAGAPASESISDLQTLAEIVARRHSRDGAWESDPDREAALRISYVPLGVRLQWIQYSGIYSLVEFAPENTGGPITTVQRLWMITDTLKRIR